MTIRNRTTKAQRADKNTGRGKTPAKKSNNVSPVIGRVATFAVQEGATDYSVTPLGFTFCVYLSRGFTPACNLRPFQGFGGTIADNHLNYVHAKRRPRSVIGAAVMVMDLFPLFFVGEFTTKYTTRYIIFITVYFLL